MKFYLFADFLSTLKYYLSNSHTQLCSVFFQGTLHDLVFRNDARPGQTESQLDKVFNLRILATLFGQSLGLGLSRYSSIRFFFTKNSPDFLSDFLSTYQTLIIVYSEKLLEKNKKNK